jgi:hypothetical protein
MIPERFAPVLFGFILSGLMSFVVSPRRDRAAEDGVGLA